jgi:hypothetical protein
MSRAALTVVSFSVVATMAVVRTNQERRKSVAPGVSIRMRMTDENEAEEGAFETNVGV